MMSRTAAEHTFEDLPRRKRFPWLRQRVPRVPPYGFSRNERRRQAGRRNDDHELLPLWDRNDGVHDFAMRRLSESGEYISEFNRRRGEDTMPTRAPRPHSSAEQLSELERLLSLCEVQAVRSGVPLPLGAHPRGDGVNFAIFGRHATGVRLDLFANPEDAMPTRSIILDAARNKTGDIWCGWRESGRAGSGLRIAGPYAPHDGHRFNPNKLVVDPYATAIASLPGGDFRAAFGYDPSSAQQDLSFSRNSMMRGWHRNASSPTMTSTGKVTSRFACPGHRRSSTNSTCVAIPSIPVPASGFPARIAA